MYPPHATVVALALPSAVDESALDILVRHERFVVVNKPTMVLSVPGKGPDKVDSIATRARAMFPRATGTMVVHRLDWETSGAMVLALDAEAQVRLGRQFEKRIVRKSYLAVVAGVPREREGEIRLPIRPDYSNRPYQIVDEVGGREAVTAWRVLWTERRDGAECARLELKPRTGRTHQLRVHAALGLGMPILGDPLYGDADSAERLLLHAASLEFWEPVKHGARWVRAEAPVPF